MLSRLTVKAKLILLLAVAIGASVLLGIVGALGLRETTSSIAEIGEVRLPSVLGLALVSEGQTAVRAENLRALGLDNDFKVQDKFREVLRSKQEIWARINKGWNIYAPLPQTPEETLLWVRFVREWHEWKADDQAISATIFALSENRGASGQRALFAELARQMDADAEKFSAAASTLKKILDLNVKVGEASVLEGNAGAAWARTTMLAVGVAAIGLLLLLGGFIVRSILRQLGGDPLEVSRIASQIAAGDLSVQLETKQGDTGSMLMSISHMAQQLRKRALDLEESRAQLRGLLTHREEIREDERKQIAREVHDELGQILSGLKLTTSLLIHKYGADSEALREHALQIKAMTNEAISVVREITATLRPVELAMGLAPALKLLAERCSMLTGIQCELHIAEQELRVEENDAFALFRIAQEALTNIARHSEADKMSVSLVAVEDEYVLKVSDNGKGFDADKTPPGSFGLVGMRERVLMQGGTLRIDSRPGNGTAITVHIPRRKNCD